MKFTASVVAALVVANASAAITPNARPLSLEDFHTLFITDAGTEYNDSEDLFAAASSHAWDSITATSSLRALSGSPPYLHPFLVCEHTPDTHGVDRALRVNALFGEEHVRVNHNAEEKTCFSVRATAEAAANAPEDMQVHPYTSALKLALNTVSRLSSSESDISSEAPQLRVNLCGSPTFDERSSLAQSFLSGLDLLFSPEGGVSRRALTDAVFWTSDRSSSSRRTTATSSVWESAVSAADSDRELCAGALDFFGAVPSPTSSGAPSVSVEGLGRYVDDLRAKGGEDLVVRGKACLMAVAAYLAEQPEVCSLGARPLMKLRNYEAKYITQGGVPRSTTSTTVLNGLPLWTKGIQGEGQVVAVSDTGLDNNNCYFRDATVAVPVGNTGTPFSATHRKIAQYFSKVDTTDYQSGHGTHVCGSIVGHKSTLGTKNGEADGFADGNARNARVAFYDIGDSKGDLTGLNDFAPVYLTPGYTAGARIHSASWGSTDNNYADNDAEMDAFTETHPDFLMFIAAGNDGTKYQCKGDLSKDPNYDTCPDFNNDGKIDFSDYKITKNVVSSVGSPANAKNIIAVGASVNANTGMDLTWDKGYEYVADFSSRGPALDLRRKPELIAPGAQILSANAQPGTSGECDPSSRPQYGNTDTWTASSGIQFMQGTSMATPTMAGNAALVRQYFMEGWYPTGVKTAANALTPSGALLKAVLLNSGQALKGSQNYDGTTTVSAIYDNNQGFGRVALIKGLKLTGLNTAGFGFWTIDNQVLTTTANSLSWDFTITSMCTDNSISAMLVWTDPANTGGATRPLLNDLDLLLTKKSDGTKSYPNGLTMKDSINNSERIRLASIAVGTVYTLSVTGTTFGKGSSQKFALSVTGCMEQGSSSPTPSTPSTPKPTKAPTKKPTRSPIKAGETSSPTLAPTIGGGDSGGGGKSSDKFCEVVINFTNLLLSNADGVAPSAFSVDAVEQAFGNSVATVAPNAATLDNTWVCAASSKSAVVEASTLDGMFVDFTVTGRVADVEDCDSADPLDQTLISEVVASIFNAIYDSAVPDGSLQAALRDNGSLTWLQTVTVDRTYLLPTPLDISRGDGYETGTTTELKRTCNSLNQAMEWIKGHLAVVIGGAIGGIVAMVALGFGIAYCVRNGSGGGSRPAKSYAGKAQAYKTPSSSSGSGKKGFELGSFNNSSGSSSSGGNKSPMHATGKTAAGGTRAASPPRPPVRGAPGGGGKSGPRVW